VESLDDPSAVGDNGRALGAYQIHHAYFIDSRMEGNYKDVVTDPNKADDVVLNYFKRYGKGKTFRQLARIHNGGPRGYLKECTQDYADKVMKQYYELLLKSER
jgi:hypothetical protein